MIKLKTSILLTHSLDFIRLTPNNILSLTQKNTRHRASTTLLGTLKPNPPSIKYTLSSRQICFWFANFHPPLSTNLSLKWKTNRQRISTPRSPTFPNQRKKERKKGKESQKRWRWSTRPPRGASLSAWRVFARFLCLWRGGRERQMAWLGIDPWWRGGGGGEWLDRMRVSRDSVSVLIDPRRGREKGRNGKRNVASRGWGGGGVGGRFLDRNGTVPCTVGLRARLGSSRFSNGPWLSVRSSSRGVAVLLLSFGESSILGFIRRGDGWSFMFCCWKEWGDLMKWILGNRTHFGK